MLFYVVLWFFEIPSNTVKLSSVLLSRPPLKHMETLDTSQEAIL